MTAKSVPRMPFMAFVHGQLRVAQMRRIGCGACMLLLRCNQSGWAVRFLAFAVSKNSGDHLPEDCSHLVL